jgi:NAD(P)-dependent dehydrogenase (short-subunit alcohol dehydrogenase family)
MADAGGMTFLITGASRGIGYELAVFALENKHEVIALARDPNRSPSLHQAQKEYKDQLTVLKCDVTDLNDIVAAQKVVGSRPIDVLINNAGVLMDDEDKFSQVPLEKISSTLLVNSLAPVAVTQVFLQNLTKATSPKLICITSQMGSIGDNSSGGYYAYRMSKAALNMFVKSFSIDYPKITTLTLHPGWVRTEMGGAQAPTLPRESARGLYKIITEATSSQTGHFYDYRGKELPW